MFTRLEPPIPMNTVKGDGYAFAVIDYGFEADLIWVIVLDETRESGAYLTPRSVFRRTGQPGGGTDA